MPITVAGLPAHPLLVHAVVVLVPLATLGAVAVAARPAWNRPYGPLVAAGAVGGAVMATLAKVAGDQLAVALRIPSEMAGQIEEHGRLGLYTMYATWPFAVLAVAAAVLPRRAGVPATTTRVVAALAALAGAVALVCTTLAGDSGARAVWGFLAS